MATTLLVLVCGLPGSGKSTFCEQVVQHVNAVWPDRTELLTVNVVSFDAVYDNMPAAGDTFDPARWKESRAHALHLTEALVRTPSSPSRHGQRRARLILCDDNFYLRSMRRPFYQLARDYGIAFLVMWFDVNAADAWARNCQRPAAQAVSHDTFQRMCQNMEPPALSDSSGAASGDAQYHVSVSVRPPVDAAPLHLTDFVLDWARIHAAFHNIPAPVPIVDEAALVLFLCTTFIACSSRHQSHEFFSSSLLGHTGTTTCRDFGQPHSLCGSPASSSGGRCRRSRP
jgi:predicted kinase